MNLIYNTAVNAANSCLRLYSKCLRRKGGRKFSRFVKGRRGLLEKVQSQMAVERDKEVYWFHAASLGEYQVIRPIIESVKQRAPQSVVVLTFFSPSGYEALERRKPQSIDYLYYLPIDTASNARRMVEALHPRAAVIAVSEYWPNMLQQLKFHAVPTYLVSAIIRDDSPFFRWYGRTYRKALSAFSHIFTLNHRSIFNLKMLGYNNASLSGDPLMDNAAMVARTPWSNEVIETFCCGQKPMIAGSLSDTKDLELVAAVINANPADKFIVVPHETNPKAIARIEAALQVPCAIYSRLTDLSEQSRHSLQQAKALIVDTVGILAMIYRYGSMAYIGGGFTPLLHSVIEATVYGLPVAFGPRIERKITPRQLMDRGIGCMVNSAPDLMAWYTHLHSNPQALAHIRGKATAYVEEKCGSTARIVEKIMNAEL